MPMSTPSSTVTPCKLTCQAKHSHEGPYHARRAGLTAQISVMNLMQDAASDPGRSLGVLTKSICSNATGRKLLTVPHLSG